MFINEYPVLEDTFLDPEAKFLSQNWEKDFDTGFPFWQVCQKELVPQGGSQKEPVRWAALPT
ncbi:MAG: hypothetical protein V7L25_19100 [Nostoc sp.]|uniref:hypothetical protein n=1 Tax=Nostoc sp. TaxID=1180 RepID=UPI002FF359F2